MIALADVERTRNGGRLEWLRGSNTKGILLPRYRDGEGNPEQEYRVQYLLRKEAGDLD